MCSKKKHSFPGTVTFRLTLLFVSLFTLLLVAVLIPIDFSLRSIMVSRLDTKIAGKLGDGKDRTLVGGKDIEVFFQARHELSIRSGQDHCSG